VVVGVFCFDTKDVGFRDRNLRKQSFARHPVITVGMVWRYTTLITPKEIDGLPGNSFEKRRLGEQRKHRFRRRTAGERHREHVAAEDVLIGEPRKAAGGFQRQFVAILVNSNLSIPFLKYSDSHKSLPKNQKMKRQSRANDAEV